MKDECKVRAIATWSQRFFSLPAFTLGSVLPWAREMTPKVEFSTINKSRKKTSYSTRKSVLQQPVLGRVGLLTCKDLNKGFSFVTSGFYCQEESIPTVFVLYTKLADGAL